MTVVEVVSLGGMAALLAIAALTFHKTRRAHLVALDLATRVKATQREVATLYGQMQAFHSLAGLLRLPWPLPTLRGWAGSPDFLLEIAKHVLEAKPEVVMECSSGSSTLVLARCLQLNGAGHVYSMEHEPQFAQQTRHQLRLQQLEAWATVVDAPLRGLAGAEGRVWYSLDNLPPAARNVAMLVVDGPPAELCAEARLPAVPRLMPYLAEHCTVFLDDADRADERAALRAWLEEFPEFSSRVVPCEKGCVRLDR